jgi:hypothetical protein
MNGTCFVISPFGDPFDEYYEKIYKPAIAKADLQSVRGDEVYGTGAVIDDIFAQISAASVVLCDVTGKNPNVNYELGVAHALRVPSIIVTQSIADVPFDYRHLRAIPYDRTKVDWAKELEAAVHKTLISVLGNPQRGRAWSPKEPGSERPASDESLAILLSYMPDPSVATLRYRDQFVHLGARRGDVHPGFKQFFEEVYVDVQSLQSKLSESEYLQLRKIWHDDTDGNIGIWVDLIHNSGQEPTFSEEELRAALHSGEYRYGHQMVSITARVLERSVWSDSFFPNAREFYEGL